jgi:hypothetical protein
MESVLALEIDGNFYTPRHDRLVNEIIVVYPVQTIKKFPNLLDRHKRGVDSFVFWKAA